MLLTFDHEIRQKLSMTSAYILEDTVYERQHVIYYPCDLRDFIIHEKQKIIIHTSSEFHTSILIYNSILPIHS